MNKPENFTPSATMLLSSHCAYCPAVLEALTKLIKDGDIAKLQVINLEKNPDAMQHYNVRSVPWVKIGNHELSGSQTYDALKQRVSWAIEDAQQDNSTDYKVSDIDFLLSDGQVNKVISAINSDPSLMQHIMTLLGDSGTVLSSRIGIGVVFEELAGTDILTSHINELQALSQHDDERIRADAYHYLGMTADRSVTSFLKTALTHEKNEALQEIITDSLDELRRY